MTTPNYANPVLGHSETLREDEIKEGSKKVSFYLKRKEWHTDWFAWTEYAVEMYVAKPRRRGKGKMWPSNLIAEFKFGDRDTANQLFALMVKGKKHDIM